MITIEEKNLTFEQIQEALATEGINLSRSKFREYVTIGLVKSFPHHGGTRGSRMATYAKGLEIVRIIHQLNQRPNRIELRDIMYLLYWRGLPIDDTKLFYQLLEYQKCLVVKMNNVAQDRRADPEEVKEEIKENIAQGLRKFYFKPGAPSNEVQAAYDDDVLRHTAEMDHLYSFIQSLVENGFISSDLLSSYYSQGKEYTQDTIHVTSSFIEKYINYEFLVNPKPFTNPEHIAQARELVTLVQEYINDFFKLLDNQLPEDDLLRHILHQFFSTAALQNHPLIAKQALFVLMANGYVPTLLTFLKENKEIWKTMVDQFLMQKDINLFAEQ